MANSNNANPSLDPANNGTVAGMLNQVLDKFLQNTDDMLPAIVIAYNRTSNTATVKPMVKMVSTTGQQISRAQIENIPVLQIGGGGFLLNFNIQAGNLGWIKASDRDISLFMQGFSENSPNTKRKHSFSDGIFIPHVMTGFTIDEDDASNVVLQNLDGSVKISLGADKITIKAPEVFVDTENLNCTGDLNVTGELVANGITYSTHIHSGVQVGGGNTGEPV